MQDFLNISLLLTKKRHQQVDRQMSNLKGSAVKPEFLGKFPWKTFLK